MSEVIFSHVTTVAKLTGSVAKSGILSRDLGIFYISWDVFGILILKIQTRDFFGIFQNSSSKFSNQVFGEVS